jgi:hypothetical protein
MILEQHSLFFLYHVGHIPYQGIARQPLPNDGIQLAEVNLWIKMIL